MPVEGECKGHGCRQGCVSILSTRPFLPAPALPQLHPISTSSPSHACFLTARVVRPLRLTLADAGSVCDCTCLHVFGHHVAACRSIIKKDGRGVLKAVGRQVASYRPDLKVGSGARRTLAVWICTAMHRAKPVPYAAAAALAGRALELGTPPGGA